MIIRRRRSGQRLALFAIIDGRRAWHRRRSSWATVVDLDVRADATKPPIREHTASAVHYAARRGSSSPGLQSRGS
jgi:hypothetical protein